MESVFWSSTNQDFWKRTFETRWCTNKDAHQNIFCPNMFVHSHVFLGGGTIWMGTWVNRDSMLNIRNPSSSSVVFGRCRHACLQLGTWRAINQIDHKTLKHTHSTYFRKIHKNLDDGQRTMTDVERRTEDDENGGRRTNDNGGRQRRTQTDGRRRRTTDGRRRNCNI